jgi:PAS domain S-box-containing protein
LRVLIVDDHEVVRRGVRSLLSSNDRFEICGEAFDGRDAIEKARQLRPDVIILDISMPNLNGLEATREIRRFLPEVPILIMSQHDVPEMMKQALHAGATAYIVKSAITTELLAALERVREKEIPPGLVFGSAHANLNVQELLNEKTAALDRATKELEMAVTHLDMVASHAAVAVTRCSRDLRYLWVNPGYAEWLQLPISEIVGQPIKDVLGPEVFESLSPHFERVLKGERVAYEQEVPYKRIGRRWISAIYTPALDNTGMPDGWVAVVLDMTERHEMEQTLRDSKARLDEEAKSFRKLYELSSRLWATRDLEQGLKLMLDAAIQLLAADKGNVQLLDKNRNVLTIVAQEGFDQAFLEFFREVSAEDGCVCGRALRNRQTVIVPDVQADEVFAPYREAARLAGYRAVTSMPLFASDGTVVGILSTHFRSVHVPNDDSLRRLELYARQAGDFIARCNSQTELEKKVDRRTTELWELSGSLLKAQDQERRRFARELHDGVGQLLAATSMNIARVSQEKDKLSPAAARCLEENVEIMRQAIEETRTVSYLLHPPLLEESGLDSALNEYVRGFGERSKIAVTLNLPEDFERLPNDYELSMFRVVQECLTNIHRHSGAKSAVIVLRCTPDHVVLEVSDDGHGFEAAGGEVNGVGLRGMRERLRQIGGSLQVSSSERGTLVQAVLPVGKRRAKEVHATHA